MALTDICIMLVVLPFSVYVLLTIIFARSFHIHALAVALIKTHLLVFTFVVVATELLSLFNAITFASLCASWSVCLVICILLIYTRRRQIVSQLPHFDVPHLSATTAPLVATILVILTGTFATAVLFPPNTWDSHTYHMARVAHWESNQTVSFYATENQRQNCQMPLAEFAILHLQILTQSDLFANLIQWISLPVLICLSSLIAAELGLNKSQQLVSAVVTATIPMVILQASSTQNDLVLSSFVMCFAYFMLRLRSDINVTTTAFAAIALGLALLTKGTAYIYCGTLGLCITTSIIAAHRSRSASLVRPMISICCIPVLALVINAGHLTRNCLLYGSPLSTGGINYLNEDMSAQALITSLARNSALHLATPQSRINDYTFRALHLAMGKPELSLFQQDPKTTWSGTKFKVIYSHHEDLAGNGIHMVIVFVSVLILVHLWCRRPTNGVLGYFIGIVLGGVCYCWLLKWQPWASRLHTPLFALASPLLAMALTANFGSPFSWITRSLVYVMILYSLPFLFTNPTRSLISLDWLHKPRQEMYFTNQMDLYREYVDAFQVLEDSGTRRVGLYIGGDDWEYPWWALAKEASHKNKPITFQYVGISEPSLSTDQSVVLPRHLIAMKDVSKWEHASEYDPVYTGTHVTILKRTPAGLAPASRH